MIQYNAVPLQQKCKYTAVKIADYDIIMLYQTITLIVCSSLLHEIIEIWE